MAAANLLNRVMFALLFLAVAGFSAWGFFHDIELLIEAHGANVTKHLEAMSGAVLPFFLLLMSVWAWRVRKPKD
jgi:cytosine/uracil/thiamine/allantoin permease